ncbi:TonB family protein [Pigmentiphaga humi]|nr:TonB family protein [Pigmentiphaga humi]
MQALAALPARLGEDWRTRPERRYLMSAIAISMAAHLILFALHFTMPPQARSPERDAGLEVILLNAGTREAPAHAQLLAQVASDGGGDARDGHARSPVPRSAAARDGERLAQLQQRQAALEAQQRELAAALAQRRVPAPMHGTAGTPRPEQSGSAAQAEQLARRFAEISERIDDYNKRPRKHFFAPSTSEHRFAVYVEQWRHRIEEIGNRNYPAGARGKVYGSLRMTVYVRSDGTVESMDIDKPSEHKILNDAARRTVSLAAPFAPFPPQISRDTDVLAITRTWYFTNDTLSAKPR